jgi:hypothetical protein
MNIYILDLKVQTNKKVILPQCKRCPLLVTKIASNIKKKKKILYVHRTNMFPNYSIYLVMSDSFDYFT